MIQIRKENITPESVKISAYLNPHPLDEDSNVEIEDLVFLPGFDSQSIDDDEAGEHPIFRDSNCELYERIEKMTESMFRKAITNIWPLLDSYIFNRISISIDYTGLLLGESSLAAYNYVDSRPEHGYYHFDLTKTYILRQLNNSQAGRDLSLKFTTTWEHEIVHLLDHWESVKVSMFQDSLESGSVYKYYILKYRSEGIAELYYLLKGGIEDIKTLQDAKQKLAENITTTRNKLSGVNKISEKEKETILKTYDFYEIGPWIILDILNSFEGEFHKEFIQTIIADIENRITITDEKILQVIKIALRLKNYEFLERIEANYA